MLANPEIFPPDDVLSAFITDLSERVGLGEDALIPNVAWTTGLRFAERLRSPQGIMLLSIAGILFIGLYIDFVVSIIS